LTASSGWGVLSKENPSHKTIDDLLSEKEEVAMEDSRQRVFRLLEEAFPANSLREQALLARYTAELLAEKGEAYIVRHLELFRDQWGHIRSQAA